MSAATTRTVPSGDVRLAVREQGDPAGPTVLLVHGYPDTHHVWDDVAEALAADHRVVRYDVRGAGGSSRPRGLRAYRLPRLADDLFAVADAVSPDRPVHVVAHDWGSIQSWEAATDPRARERIASYTSLSGPCLDHIGHWIRHRLTHPTPRHLAQLLNQLTHSWYIALFHLPALAPAAWRGGLARRWPSVLRLLEDVGPRPGHPAPTLADDAVRGISLYRANMLPRLLRPRFRPAQVPVQIVTLTRDHYVSPALSEGLERWAPHGLTRRTLPATHWSALLEKGPTVARMIRDVTRGTGDAHPGELAVVTGAGSGIGRATALALAEQGTDLALCDIDLAAAERTAELARALGPRPVTARAWRVDVSDGEAVEAFAADVCASLRTPGIVVNNAGIGHSGAFLDTTQKEWQRVLDVNLWGVIHGCRAFGSRLAERGQGGHIVNVASAAAYLPSRMLAAYSTSKAAVLMLSECLRAELGASGIGVSAICPGVVHTNITSTTTFAGLDAGAQAARRRRVSAMYARRNYPPEKVAAQILKSIRANRPLTPVTFEARATRVLSRLAPGVLRTTARLRLR